ncbi:MAG: inorganic diphosphatase, partial [Methylococcaceae bacterium]
TDESGEDAKVLAVPVDKLTPFYKKVQTFNDIPEITLVKISHFFEHYKDLEEGKWVKIEGWFGIEEAKKEIVDSVERYKAELK